MIEDALEKIRCTLDLSELGELNLESPYRIFLEISRDAVLIKSDSSGSKRGIFL